MMSKRVMLAIICVCVCLLCFCSMQVSASSEPYTRTVVTDMGNYYAFKTNFYNISSERGAYSVIFASYKNGEMIDVELREHEVGYESYTLADYDKVKIIVVDNTDTISPITTVEVIDKIRPIDTVTSDKFKGLNTGIDSYGRDFYAVHYDKYGKYSYPQYYDFIKEEAELYFNGGEQHIDQFETLMDKYYGTMDIYWSRGEDAFLPIIYITDYDTLVVDSVNAATGRVMSKNSRNLTYNDTDGFIISTLYDTDGNEMKWEDLKEWDVVSYTIGYSNPNYEEIVGYVIDNNVSGAVTGMWSDEVAIGGVRYNINTEYLNGSEYYLGDYGTFYVDIMGNIVWYQLYEKEGDKYAYVSEAEVIADFDMDLQLKMFTADGCIDSYSLADNVRYNGTTYRCYDLATDEIAAELSNVFINYELDEDNRISIIKTPTTWSSVSKATDFTIYGTEAEESAFTEGTESLTTSTGRVYTTKDTKIFILGDTDEEFRVLTSAELFDGDVLKKATFYNVNENLEVEYVLVKEGVTSSVEEDLTAAVGVSGGEEEMSFFKNGELLTFPVNNYYFDKEIPAFGSVYIPVISGTDEVKTVKELAAVKDGMVDISEYAKFANSRNGNELYYVDNIVSVEGNTVTSETEGDIVIPTTADVYFVDDEVKAGSIEDLSLDGENEYVIFVQELDGEITTAVVYAGCTKYVIPEVITAEYGYVRRTMVVTEFEGYMQFRIFTGDGLFDTYMLAEKVNFNGEIVDAEDLATDEYAQMFTEALVYFERKENNEIISLKTVSLYGEEVEESLFEGNGFTTSENLVTTYLPIFLVGETEEEYGVCLKEDLRDGDVLKNVSFYYDKTIIIVVKGGIVKAPVPETLPPVSVAALTGSVINNEGLEFFDLAACSDWSAKSYYFDPSSPYSPPALGSAFIPDLAPDGTVNGVRELTVSDPRSYEVSLGADAIDGPEGNLDVMYYLDTVESFSQISNEVTLSNYYLLTFEITDDTNVVMVDGRYSSYKDRIKLGWFGISIVDFEIDWSFWDYHSCDIIYPTVCFAREVDGVVTDVVFYVNYTISE